MTVPTPQELRRQADAIEARNCTGLTASWCPVHGDCICDPEQGLDDPQCLLHAHSSSHAC